MRVLSFVLAAVVVMSLAACSKNDTSSTTTSGTAAPPDTSVSTTATAAPAAEHMAGADDMASVPNYPGSKQEAAGSSAQGAGKVLSTSDTFDKVYAFYKSKLPAGAEKAKIDIAGHQNAVFQVGTGPKAVAVTITSNGPKTMITVAQSK